MEKMMWVVESDEEALELYWRIEFENAKRQLLERLVEEGLNYHSVNLDDVVNRQVMFGVEIDDIVKVLKEDEVVMEVLREVECDG